jgi:hypothetical protein
MTLGYVAATRNAKLDAITTQVGTGALIEIYSGTRPATGGTATTILAQLSISGAFAAAASGGVLTVNTVTGDTSANASGTASWFRVMTSGSTPKIDGSVTATGGGGDLQLVTTTITAGQPVNITSFTITDGNP